MKTLLQIKLNIKILSQFNKNKSFERIFNLENTQQIDLLNICYLKNIFEMSFLEM